MPPHKAPTLSGTENTNSNEWPWRTEPRIWPLLLDRHHRDSMVRRLKQHGVHEPSPQAGRNPSPSVKLHCIWKDNVSVFPADEDIQARHVVATLVLPAKVICTFIG